MLDSLVSSIENAFIQFSFRRLLYILFLFVVILSAVFAFNEMTGYTLYSRINNKINALERLQALEEKNIGQSAELGPIYQSIVEELNQKPWQPLSLHITFDPAIKFLAATLIPFIFVFVGLFKILRGDKDGSRTLGGALLVTLMLGLPAVLIPTWRTAWYNAGIYFVIQIVLIVFTLKYSGSSKSDAAGVQKA
jgi:hypothetical protein